jgi:hypothetical protein
MVFIKSLTVCHVPTQDRSADALTKPMFAVRFPVLV